MDGRVENWRKMPKPSSSVGVIIESLLPGKADVENGIGRCCGPLRNVIKSGKVMV